MKYILLALIAHAAAAAAIVSDGITYPPFIEGAMSAPPAISADFVGVRWQDGDETAFAGLALLRQRIVPKTGP